MRVIVLTRGVHLGAGAEGYAHRLLGAWPARSEPVVVGIGERPGLGFAWRHRAVRRNGAPVLSLERTVAHDVIRAGGGVDDDFRRALGLRRSRRMRALEQRGWDVAGVVVANSAMVASALRRRTTSRIEIIRTGVDHRRFTAPRVSPGDRVLFAAHGWRRKGFEHAVRAMIAFPHLELWVAGRDRRRERLLERARRVLPRLVDLGPRVDIAEVLPQVDVVLHPTLYDPASNLVLEAMAAGVPVVTTPFDGSSELLPPELVADPRALRTALRVALSGGEALGRELRRRIEPWPDSRNAEELEELLWELK